MTTAVRSSKRTIRPTLIGRPIRYALGIGHRILSPTLSDGTYCKLKYLMKFGRLPDLERPYLFTEKLLWLGLNKRCPKYTLCADKFKVRQYVSRRGGERYLVPLIKATDNPAAIEWESLPSQFVLKPNHTSGQILKVEDCGSLDKVAVVQLLNRWLKLNHYSRHREWQYKDIKPLILIEELLVRGERDLKEYRFHCCNGKLNFIQVKTGRFTGNLTERCYSIAWEELPFVIADPRSEKQIPRPSALDEMVAFAETLATEFDYVRVDLYYVDEKIYFSEMTFSPAAVFYLNIKPNEYNRILGEQLILTSKDQSSSLH